ncbi:aminoglycoside phosphotransferase [Anaerobacillus alkaliphilus]|uniref:Aminoglycoside phosphotransferase n=1 Tax=Anaerobacillus alkaliphilus TaxID=1548597 RepID=A0A4Q0VLY8_9BACI|nr:phosphotransferase [Anaerobacillus alkaliphilus]RXI96213.1 aminoglycoside phosphotransferase [Anaerobacillus alkaliphilus]
MSVENEFTFLIDYFFLEKVPVNIYEGKSGYNNTTRYLNRNNQTYILRIYETHNEEAKVRLEHEVLLKLSRLSDLPFKVPVPVVKEGNSLVQLPSKKIGCIYHYIEGDNPVFNNEDVLFSFGQSVGHLLNALQKVEIKQPLVYRPYYEIEHTHPKCPVSKVLEWCSNPPDFFQGYKSELEGISTMLMNFQANIPFLKSLPHQIIHGDLNASNVLVGADQTINAILDFEFITEDLRVMEVAVCMSDMISQDTIEDGYLKQIRHFYAGFSTTMSLLASEIEVLPILVQLRRLDVFIHFLGRYLDGIDDPSVLKEQITKTAAYRYWIDDGGQKLLHMVSELNEAYFQPLGHKSD